MQRITAKGGGLRPYSFSRLRERPEGARRSTDVNAKYHGKPRLHFRIIFQNLQRLKENNKDC
ncbi:hypothetical protein JYT29_03400 [Nitrospina gracilis]|nr:hypothetical protein [Nitrospina gracilis]